MDGSGYPGAGAVILKQEVQYGAVKVKDDGQVVHDFDAAIGPAIVQDTVKERGVDALVVLVSPLDVLGGQGTAIVKLQPRA